MDLWFHFENLDLWKITPDFYNNFSDFGGGSPPPSPPAYATDWLYQTLPQCQHMHFAQKDLNYKGLS